MNVFQQIVNEEKNENIQKLIVNALSDYDQLEADCEQFEDLSLSKLEKVQLVLKVENAFLKPVKKRVLSFPHNYSISLPKISRNLYGINYMSEKEMELMIPQDVKEYFSKRTIRKWAKQGTKRINFYDSKQEDVLATIEQMHISALINDHYDYLTNDVKLSSDQLFLFLNTIAHYDRTLALFGLSDKLYNNIQVPYKIL